MTTEWERYVKAHRECSGAADCTAGTHIHGCYADYGACTMPEEHRDD